MGLENQLLERQIDVRDGLDQRERRALAEFLKERDNAKQVAEEIRKNPQFRKVLDDLWKGAAETLAARVRSFADLAGRQDATLRDAQTRTGQELENLFAAARTLGASGVDVAAAQAALHSLAQDFVDAATAENAGDAATEDVWTESKVAVKGRGGVLREVTKREKTRVNRGLEASLKLVGPILATGTGDQALNWLKDVHLRVRDDGWKTSADSAAYRELTGDMHAKILEKLKASGDRAALIEFARTVSGRNGGVDHALLDPASASKALDAALSIRQEGPRGFSVLERFAPYADPEVAAQGGPRAVVETAQRLGQEAGGDFFKAFPQFAALRSLSEGKRLASEQEAVLSMLARFVRDAQAAKASFGEGNSPEEKAALAVGALAVAVQKQGDAARETEAYGMSRADALSETVKSLTDRMDLAGSAFRERMEGTLGGDPVGLEAALMKAEISGTGGVFVSFTSVEGLSAMREYGKAAATIAAGIALTVATGGTAALALGAAGVSVAAGTAGAAVVTGTALVGGGALGAMSGRLINGRAIEADADLASEIALNATLGKLGGSVAGKTMGTLKNAGNLAKMAAGTGLAATDVVLGGAAEYGRQHVVLGNEAFGTHDVLAMVRQGGLIAGISLMAHHGPQVLAGIRADRRAQESVGNSPAQAQALKQAPADRTIFITPDGADQFARGADHAAGHETAPAKAAPETVTENAKTDAKTAPTPAAQGSAADADTVLDIPTERPAAESPVGRPGPSRNPREASRPFPRREFSRTEVEANADLADGARIAKAEEILGRALTQEQKNAVIEAHELELPALATIGANGEALPYSGKEVTGKRNVLLNAGFTPEERYLLMKSGICGIADRVRAFFSRANAPTSAQKAHADQPETAAGVSAAPSTKPAGKPAEKTDAPTARTTMAPEQNPAPPAKLTRIETPPPAIKTLDDIGAEIADLMGDMGSFERAIDQAKTMLRQPARLIPGDPGNNSHMRAESTLDRMNGLLNYAKQQIARKQSQIEAVLLKDATPFLQDPLAARRGADVQAKVATMDEAEIQNVINTLKTNASIADERARMAYEGIDQKGMGGAAAVNSIWEKYREMAASLRYDAEEAMGSLFEKRNAARKNTQANPTPPNETIFSPEKKPLVMEIIANGHPRDGDCFTLKNGQKFVVETTLPGDMVRFVGMKGDFPFDFLRQRAEQIASIQRNGQEFTQGAVRTPGAPESWRSAENAYEQHPFLRVFSDALGEAPIALHEGKNGVVVVNPDRPGQIIKFAKPGNTDSLSREFLNHSDAYRIIETAKANGQLPKNVHVPHVDGVPGVRNPYFTMEKVPGWNLATEALYMANRAVLGNDFPRTVRGLGDAAAQKEIARRMGWNRHVFEQELFRHSEDILNALKADKNSDVARALAALRDGKLAHADAHAQNIMHDPETNQYYIIDFGRVTR